MLTKENLTRKEVIKSINSGNYIPYLLMGILGLIGTIFLISDGTLFKPFPIPLFVALGAAMVIFSAMELKRIHEQLYGSQYRRRMSILHSLVEHIINMYKTRLEFIDDRTLTPEYKLYRIDQLRLNGYQVVETLRKYSNTGEDLYKMNRNLRSISLDTMTEESAMLRKIERADNERAICTERLLHYEDVLMKIEELLAKFREKE